MEITARGLWTMVHGMGFGALYLLACSGAIVEVWRRYSPRAAASATSGDAKFLRVYLIVMAGMAWLKVLTGAYVIYPWYRAVAPAGTTQLAAYPQRLLMSSPSTIAWHSIGMEWKEHVAWLAPIAVTMAAGVAVRYGRELRNQRVLRRAMMCFLLVSFLAAGTAGFFGAMLNKNAPVAGGTVFHLAEGRK
jgi:hypothetical protein